MNAWYYSNLGDAMLAGPMQEHIKSRFVEAYEKADQPADMALFVRHESEGRLHCEAMLYFTPAAAGVARAVGALPCGKPAPAGLDLLTGSRRAFATWFPETQVPS